MLRFLRGRVVVVRSFRHDLVAQARSQQLSFTEAKRQSLAHMVEELRAATKLLKQTTASVPHFDLPMESFSVEAFNRLLKFLHVRGCGFNDVLWNNRNGTYSHVNDGYSGTRPRVQTAPRAEQLMWGNCTLAPPARRGTPISRRPG